MQVAGHLSGKAHSSVFEGFTVWQEACVTVDGQAINFINPKSTHYMLLVRHMEARLCRGRSSDLIVVTPTLAPFSCIFDLASRN